MGGVKSYLSNLIRPSEPEGYMKYRKEQNWVDSPIDYGWEAKQVGKIVKERLPYHTTYPVLRAMKLGKIPGDTLMGKYTPTYRDALDMAALTTMPAFGAKPGMTMAPLGAGALRSKVRGGLGTRISNLGEQISAKQARGKAAKTLQKQQMLAEAAFSEYERGMAAMPRGWMRPIKDIEVSSSKGMKKQPTVVGDAYKGHVRLNADAPIDQVIGHEAHHAVQSFVAGLNPAKIAKRPKLQRDIYVGQRFVEAVKKHTKNKAKPREFDATRIGQDFIDIYNKTGKRVTNNQAMNLYRKHLNDYVKKIKTEKPELYKKVLPEMKNLQQGIRTRRIKLGLDPI